MTRLFAVTILLAFGITTYADDADDILNKALKAQAKDVAALKKLQTHICIGKGKGRFGPDLADVTMIRQASWPGQFRSQFIFQKDATKTDVTVVIREDRGWKLQTGMVDELSQDIVSELRMDIYGIWIGMLVSLQESGVKLSTIPGIKLGDTTTVGLRVSRRLWPEMSLYFDEKTMLLRKLVFRSADGGIVKTKESYFDDYKNFDGVMLPTKGKSMYGGVEAFTYETLEYTFPATLDKELFDKPQPKK